MEAENDYARQGKSGVFPIKFNMSCIAPSANLFQLTCFITLIQYLAGFLLGIVFYCTRKAEQK